MYCKFRTIKTLQFKSYNYTNEKILNTFAEYNTKYFLSSTNTTSIQIFHYSKLYIFLSLF